MWPFLLHYPTNRIAVIDDVCMFHPINKTGSTSIYSAGGVPASSGRSAPARMMGVHAPLVWQSVLDALPACCAHLPATPPAPLPAAMPVNMRMEESLRLAEYNYIAVATKLLGFPYRSVQQLGAVPRPVRRAA